MSDDLNDDEFLEELLVPSPNPSGLNELRRVYGPKKILGTKPVKAPAREKLSWYRQAEEGFSDLSTLDVVNNMIINAYAYLKQGEYDNARKQLEILRGVDLPKVLERDTGLQKRTGRIIQELSNKLNIKN